MSTPPRPWYREPFMWLVVALPLSSVVGGIGMLVLVSRGPAADSAPEHVQRMAQVQQTDLAPDQRARALALKASGERDAAGVTLTMDAADLPAHLMLQLVHPTDAKHDVTLVLSGTGNRWTWSGDVDTNHAWRLRLGPADGRWRLVGQLPAGATRFELEPALAAD